MNFLRRLSKVYWPVIRGFFQLFFRTRNHAAGSKRDMLLGKGKPPLLKLDYYKAEEEIPEVEFPTLCFDRYPYLVFRKKPQVVQILPYLQSGGTVHYMRRTLWPSYLFNRLKVLGFSEPLTERELECTSLALCGFTSKQTAIFLDISFRTVEKHLQISYEKLGCYGKSHCMEIMYVKDCLDLWQDYARDLIHNKRHLFKNLPF